MLNFFSVETQLFQTHTHAPTFPEEGWQRIGETWNRKWNSSLCHLLYRGLFSHENPLNNADLFNVALVLSIHSIDNELETVWMMEPQSVVRMESYACDGFSQTVVVWFFGYMMVWWGSWTRAQGVDLFTWPKEEKKAGRVCFYLPSCSCSCGRVFTGERVNVYLREHRCLQLVGSVPDVRRDAKTKRPEPSFFPFSTRPRGTDSFLSAS